MAQFRELVAGTPDEDASKQDMKNNLAMLLSEYSHCLINFWKYEQCEEVMKESFELLGLDISLAGKLGKRTKWQQDDVAQLVLDIKTKSVDVKQFRDKATDAEKESKFGEDSSLYVK